MSYTFRVIFNGVCAYVPEKPFFKKVGNVKKPRKPRRRKRHAQRWKARKKIDSLAVLLPDLRRAAPTILPDSSTLRFPKGRDAHFPLLTFPLGDLCEGTTRRVDLVCRDISQQNERGMLFLRREQIRFHLEAENSRSFSFAGCVPTRNSPIPDPGKPEELESLWWLPDIERILDPLVNQNQLKSTFAERAATVDRRFMPSYRGPLQAGLISRIECHGGRLRAFDFNRAADQRPQSWRFAKPSDGTSEGSWRRVICNKVALEFYDVEGPVTIEVKRLANEVIKRQVVLAPSPGAARPVVEVEISNREPDILFQEEGLGRAVLPDLDFQAFYEKLSLAKKKIYKLPVPHPSQNFFFGITEKPCAGSGMKAP